MQRNSEAVAQMKAYDRPLAVSAMPDVARWLGVVCMIGAAIGIANGLWDLLDPVSRRVDGAEQFIKPAGTLQLTLYAVLHLLRGLGVMAGLLGFYEVATRKDIGAKIPLTLGLAGMLVFSVFGIIQFMTAQAQLAVLLGPLFQAMAPLFLGVAALRAKRVAPWMTIWIILLALMPVLIYAVLPFGASLVVHSVLWLILGYIVFQPPRQTVGASE